MNKGISLVIPSVPSDISKLLFEVNNFRSRLPISKIYIISNLNKSYGSIKDPNIELIDENSLIRFDLIKKLLLKRCNDAKIENRVGWYLQQFLKMHFARICQDEYYLLWDSDTIPLKFINLFDVNGKPYLDYKSEYHRPYFDTLSLILPGYNKIFKGSFISEHMLIKSKHMRELLDLIESNSSINGSLFYEKIINAISIKDIANSGFSEFETYGTYIYANHLKEYHLRKWKSLRFGNMFFTNSDFRDENIVNWISSYYHAISFENNQQKSPFGKYIINNKIIRNFNPVILDYISYIIRAKRRFFNNIIQIK